MKFDELHLILVVQVTVPHADILMADEQAKRPYRRANIISNMLELDICGQKLSFPDLARSKSFKMQKDNRLN